MQIRMLTLQAGPNGVRQAGQLYEVPDAEAQDLIAGGYAVEVKAKPQAALESKTMEDAAESATDESEIPETDEKSTAGVEKAVRHGKRKAAE